MKINRAKQQRQLEIAANEGVANQWRSKAKWPGNYAAAWRGEVGGGGMKVLELYSSIFGQQSS